MLCVNWDRSAGFLDVLSRPAASLQGRLWNPPVARRLAKRRSHTRLRHRSRKPVGIVSSTIGHWQPVLDAESGGCKRRRGVKIDRHALLYDGC